MANKKQAPKHPCSGCEKEKKECKSCENAGAKALQLADIDRMQREVKINLLEGDLPYNRDAYITQARFLAKQTAESMLMLGKILLMIKEKEGHGNFMRIVEEEINIPYKTAQRFMNGALASEQFPRIDFSKMDKLSSLYALLGAPDEDLKELESTGILAGNTIDDLQRMSVKEMRNLIKELKDDRESIAKGIKKEFQAEMKAYQKEIKRLSPFDPEGTKEGLEHLSEQMDSIDSMLNEADTLMRKFIFDERVLELPEIQSRVEAVQARMRSRIESLIDNWDAFVNPA
jgi:gas vesicle protein